MKRRTWLAVGSVVLGGSVVTTVAVTTTSGTSDEQARGEGMRPVAAYTETFQGGDPGKRSVPRKDTRPFSMLGVSWEDPEAELDGTAQIRTRSAETGQWTRWQDLDLDIRPPETDEGDDSGVRGASEPLWVGTSDGVEARVMADGGESAELPGGLRLVMIDPGILGEDIGKGWRKVGDMSGGGNSQEPSQQPSTEPEPEPEPSQGEPSTEPSASAPATEDPETSPEPSQQPTTEAPTGEPTGEPSPGPSTEPTGEPSTEPTGEPSGEPSTEPTGEPSPEPSTEPAPTGEPTGEPSPEPPTEPTRSPTTGPSTEPTGEPSTTAPAPSPSGTQAPRIVSRAQWGADESLVEDPPSYLSRVDAVFVHHTAGTNDYTCAQSASIIRGILTYHVKTNGWNDVGYNFFVDKCGTIFEGRAGGVDKAVQGAHTYGFNGYSAGVSLLGNYEDGGRPTQAALDAIARISGWKLGLYGADPAGKVTLTAAADTGVWKKGERATLYRISGHRDGYATLCPGANLYSQLPAIRTKAAASS
ncbi:N-acetylmuramoyl-L-alanine amidase [Streptomyces atacamensis]|uniref:N-acetylmuramoyl-L-alanine amidase n=1 Tax=Streptomyces atacamensis TaxID=531966 RepID=UPI00399D0906